MEIENNKPAKRCAMRVSLAQKAIEAVGGTAEVI
jgi:hypothetical protein